MNRKTWRTIYVLAKQLYLKGERFHCRYKMQLEDIFYAPAHDVLRLRVKYKLTNLKKRFALGNHADFTRHCSVKPKLP